MTQASRIEILKLSLEKKINKMDQKINGHFLTVKQANGQPLNDKRNAGATFKKWDKQNDAIRNTQKDIEKTERAIGREEVLISNVENYVVPDYLKDLLESGQVTQWRKNPRFFFVKGVKKARIVVSEKGELSYRYLQEITCKEQYKIFQFTYNSARALQNKGKTS